MNLLHTLAQKALDRCGLMTRAEHEALLHHKILHPVDPETDWEAKFKRAAAGLADMAEKNAGMAENVASMKNLASIADDVIYRQIDEINALRPDALAMRRKRQMDRDRRKAIGGSITAPKDGLVAINVDAPETPQVQP